MCEMIYEELPGIAFEWEHQPWKYTWYCRQDWRKAFLEESHTFQQPKDLHSLFLEPSLPETSPCPDQTGLHMPSRLLPPRLSSEPFPYSMPWSFCPRAPLEHLKASVWPPTSPQYERRIEEEHVHRTNQGHRPQSNSGLEVEMWRECWSRYLWGRWRRQGTLPLWSLNLRWFQQIWWCLGRERMCLVQLHNQGQLYRMCSSHRLGFLRQVSPLSTCLLSLSTNLLIFSVHTKSSWKITVLWWYFVFLRRASYSNWKND